MVSWIALALGSAVLSGVKDIFAKKAFKNNHYHPTQVLFFEYLFVLVISLALFYNSISFQGLSDNWWLFLIKIATLFGTSIIFYTLLQKYAVSVVSPLINASPVFLVLLSGVFFAEQVTVIQIIGILLIIGATYYLEVVIENHHHNDAHKTHHKKVKSHSKKFWFAAFSMLILISVVAISDKAILQSTSLGTDLFFTAIFMMILSSFHSVKEGHLTDTIVSLTQKPDLLIVGVLSAISLTLVVSAIAEPTAMVSLVIPLRRSSTMIAAIGGGLLFHEKHIEKKFSSVVVMLLGVVLIAL